MSTAFYEKAVTEDLDTGTGTSAKRNPNGGTHTGTQIGMHSFGEGQKSVTATWNPASIANGATEDVDVTYAGAALGDYVLASFSLDVAGLELSAQVTATNTVTATLANSTGAAVNLASGSLKVLTLKSL
jgi:hypothetical protein